MRRDRPSSSQSRAALKLTQPAITAAGDEPQAQAQELVGLLEAKALEARAAAIRSMLGLSCTRARPECPEHPVTRRRRTARGEMDPGHEARDDGLESRVSARWRLGERSSRLRNRAFREK